MVNPNLAVRALFHCRQWTCRVTQPQRLLGCAVDKSRSSKSAEVHRVHGLQYMAMLDVLRLNESLLEDDVSGAWMVWSGAAETALADAFQLVAALSLFGSWSWGVVVHDFVLLGWVVLRFARRVVLLLMLMRLVMSSCIVSGAGSRQSWMFWMHE